MSVAEPEPAPVGGERPADIAGQLADEVLCVSQTLSEAASGGSLAVQEGSPLLLGRPGALLAGGCLGVETLFGEAAEAAGHGVVHWAGPGARPSRRAQETGGGGSICRLSLDQLQHARVQEALDRCARLRAGAESFEELCRRDPAYERRRESLQRCYFEVARAVAVYVVAPRWAKPEDPGQPPLDIGGDAGWAAQMYCNRFKPIGEEDMALCQLFLFDNAEEGNADHMQDATTRGRWTYWQLPHPRNGIVEGKWITFGTAVPALQKSTLSAWKAGTGPPAPRGFYAGLGPSGPPWSSSKHEQAFAELYSGEPAAKPVAKPKGGKASGKGKAGGDGDGDVPDV